MLPVDSVEAEREAWHALSKASWARAYSGDTLDCPASLVLEKSAREPNVVCTRAVVNGSGVTGPGSWRR